MTGDPAQPKPASGPLGHPRLHLRRTDSTNERARALAIEGAPHGTLVTAAEQTAGRGRQGRSWTAPAGSALLCSLVFRDPPALLSLIAGVAVCDAVGEQLTAGHTQRAHGKRVRVKWPNDIVVEAPIRAQAGGGSPPPLGKLAGILVEGRPQEGWAVLGIGVNVAVRVRELPAQVRERAASLELPASAIEPLLEELLAALARRLGEPSEQMLQAWRARDALRGREVSWGAHSPQGWVGHGRAKGIDDEGRLLVRRDDGTTAALSAGEVHLASVG